MAKGKGSRSSSPDSRSVPSNGLRGAPPSSARSLPSPDWSHLWLRPPEDLLPPPDPTTELYRSYVAPYSRARSGHWDGVLSWKTPSRPLQRPAAQRRFFPSGTPRQRVTPRPRPLPVSPWGLQIRLPGRVFFCVRRKIRREVLFGLGISGHNKRKSPGRGGSYRRTQSSSYRC